MSSRLILLFGLVASVAALGQVQEPNGIKIGDGRLHPYFDLEGRYDSAVVYVGTVPQGDIAMRFRPGLRYELLGSNNSVLFNGSGEYVWNTGLLSSASKEASRFQADVGLDVSLNKAGQIGFDIGDHLVRSDRTNTPLFTIGVVSLFNSLQAAVPIHPGGGALEFTPKVAWQVEFFQPLINGSFTNCPATDPSCNPTVASTLNYSNVTPGLGARYRFLPKTAIVFDSGVDIRTYFDATQSARNAILMRLQAGLAGLISSKISVLVLAGYGRDFLQSNASSFIAQAELGVLLTEAINFKFGYVRTLTPVPVLGVFGDDRGYLEAKAGFGRFSISANAAVDYLTFWSGSTRRDTIVAAGITPSVKIFSWFSVSAGYNLSMRFSNVSTPGSQFIRHEAILQLHFSY